MRLDHFALLLLCAFSAWGQFVPGRYIVELTDPSASAAVVVEPSAALLRQGTRVVAPMTPSARRDAALRGRAAVRTRQMAIRGRVAAEGAEVLDSIDLVGNALFVRTDEAGAARLAQIDGVRRVVPVRLFKRNLDRAVVVHQVDKVWTRVGLDRAGEGIKIGIIDSGVDNNHPGLRDTTLPAVDGFPRVGQQSDEIFTNNKVIVARSYVPLLSRRDSDNSARDRVGHGTALAMIAAGNTNTGPRGAITGVAPKAYIGNYKIFGTPGLNDSATDDAILKAIEDGVADGMDVLSMSFGSIFAPRLEEDLDVAAVERATSMGVIVVAAAGNEGPDLNTLSSPATAPSAIAVGASSNDRVFSASAKVGAESLVAVNSDRPAAAPVSGPMADVEASDSTGLACNALPTGSFTGKIVLILRGVCTFDVKLNNVARAGARGALVYTDEARPDAIQMSTSTATLPAQMLSYSDGITVKNAIAAAGTPLTATLTFTLTAVRIDPNRMTDFSSAGPPAGLNIKPEVAAVGANFYTATQSFDSRGDMFTTSGYIVVEGTSFSTPFVAGVAALLKASHPGLTVAQYRSLIINNAKPLPQFHAQISGAGLVDALASDRATIAASPATLSFGAGGNSIGASRKITITNISGVDDTFTVTTEAKSGSASPLIDAAPRNIPAGASVTFDVVFRAADLEPGTYEGYLVFESKTAALLTEANRIRVPYWYAVKSDPANVAIIYVDGAVLAFSANADAIIFRVTDLSGVALLDVVPEVTVVSGTATVVSIEQIDRDLPGAFSVNLRFGSLAQPSVVDITAGGATTRVTLPLP